MVAKIKIKPRMRKTIGSRTKRRGGDPMTDEQIEAVLGVVDDEKALVEEMAEENKDYDPLWPEDQYEHRD